MQPQSIQAPCLVLRESAIVKEKLLELHFTEFSSAILTRDTHEGANEYWYLNVDLHLNKFKFNFFFKLTEFFLQNVLLFIYSLPLWGFKLPKGARNKGHYAPNISWY